MAKGKTRANGASLGASRFGSHASYTGHDYQLLSPRYGSYEREYHGHMVYNRGSEYKGISTGRAVFGNAAGVYLQRPTQGRSALYDRYVHSQAIIGTRNVISRGRQLANDQHKLLYRLNDLVCPTCGRSDTVSPIERPGINYKSMQHLDLRGYYAS